MSQSLGMQASRLTKDLPLGGSTTTTIPKLVYGTAWKKERTPDLVYQALKSGFRGVDTAAQPKHYFEKGVGLGVQEAVKEGIIRREDLFIQTKFSPPSSQGSSPPYDLGAPLQDQVHQSIESSLKFFTIDGQEPYLDSVVMHSPLRTIDETLVAWRTLETYTPGKIRKLGISNTTFDILKTLFEKATVKPSVVQNRFIADTDYETTMRAFCRKNGIVFQSFWTLSANGPLSMRAPVKAVAREAGVAEVAAYYSLVIGLDGIAILDGTTDEAHMVEDLQGLERVGLWAEGEGAQVWKSSLDEFKRIIGEH